MLSLRDPLTELPEPPGAGGVARAHTWQPGRRVGMILVDLDGFKDVNTVHGYPAGDAVLCETARKR